MLRPQLLPGSEHFIFYFLPYRLRFAKTLYYFRKRPETGLRLCLPVELHVMAGSTLDAVFVDIGGYNIMKL